MPFLTKVAKIINTPRAVVKTYGDTFDLLEFLAEHGAVELLEISPGSGSFKIKKVHYG